MRSGPAASSFSRPRQLCALTRRNCMASNASPIPVGMRFGQVAWVVPDIVAAERFFRQTLGVPGFAKLENLRAQDTDGTFNGKPGDFVFHLYMAYSNGILLELIQPVAGRSLYD